jgi:hypothetical protein
MNMARIDIIFEPLGQADIVPSHLSSNRWIATLFEKKKCDEQ